MVTAVKQDGEVGLAYMKNFEIEQRIRKQGIQQGIQQGKQEFIKTLVLQKREKGKDIAQIADELEQSEEMIIRIMQELGEIK